MAKLFEKPLEKNLHKPYNIHHQPGKSIAAGMPEDNKGFGSKKGRGDAITQTMNLGEAGYNSREINLAMMRFS